MPRLSFAMFKDPTRRPRAILWTGAAILTFAAIMIAALGATSTYWFCANGCHKVQDDTIIAHQRSAHSEISCMSCHMPVGADPVTFLLHKAEALGELYLTVTNQFHLPLNPGSALALDEHHMPSEQCTQCHDLSKRRITPSKGIIIDHDVHEENHIHCTMCHNRVAHREDFELTLAGNDYHDDFMEMIACYRCHGLEPDADATGECAACHTPDFELVPENHSAAGFYEEGGESGGHATMSLERPDYCRICHDVSVFCVDCHGVEMPHPDDFGVNHGEEGTSRPEVCVRCHGSAAAPDEFCNACHHQAGDPTRPWMPQHPAVTRQFGANSCFECHRPTYCAECHVRGLR